MHYKEWVGFSDSMFKGKPSLRAPAHVELCNLKAPWLYSTLNGSSSLGAHFPDLELSGRGRGLKMDEPWEDLLP